MKYKTLWLLAFVAVFADAGITLIAISGDTHSEANPVVKEMIDTFGIIPALGAGVAVQCLVLLFGIVLQRTVDHSLTEKIPIVAYLPVVLAPVVWNLWVLLL